MNKVILILLVSSLLVSPSYGQMDSMNLIILGESDSLYFMNTTPDDVIKIYGVTKTGKIKGKLKHVWENPKYNIQELYYPNLWLRFWFERTQMKIGDKQLQWTLSEIGVRDSCTIENQYGVTLGMNAKELKDLGIKEVFGRVDGTTDSLLTMAGELGLALVFEIVDGKRILREFTMQQRWDAFIRETEKYKKQDSSR